MEMHNHPELQALIKQILQNETEIEEAEGVLDKTQEIIYGLESKGKELRRQLGAKARELREKANASYCSKCGLLKKQEGLTPHNSVVCDGDIRTLYIDDAISVT